MHPMAARILSALIVLVVVVYHGLRVVATQCSGAGCDAYIPLSLLLPVAALVLAAVAGSMAAYSARAAGDGWTAILAGCAVLGSIGPVLAAFVVRDNDVLVWLSTLFVLTVPVGVGLHTVRGTT